MKEKKTVKNLLTLKSLVTIILTGVFAYLSVIGVINAEQFLTVYAVIIAFYFGVQKAKNDYGQDEKD